MTSHLAGMGRLLQYDPKNRDHEMPKLVTARRKRLWNWGEVLDQRDTPHCVGYAGYGWLQCGPCINRHLSFTPDDLYGWAQEEDEWPGTDYDGSSTLGLMKALKKRNYIGEYKWAFDADTLVNWVLEKGPVVVGTMWYMDMFTPHNKTGFIEPTGDEAGGHEWSIPGIDLDKKCPDGSVGAARMVNSWGRGWGQLGRAWMSLRSLDWLIKNQGEAVTAVEIKV